MQNKKRNPGTNSEIPETGLPRRGAQYHKRCNLRGTLKPGDRIKETYWANEIGVSQGPVREAIRDLEAMGLVETVPFKGSRVKVMTKKEIRDNYGVRICLESKKYERCDRYSVGSGAVRSRKSVKAYA